MRAIVITQPGDADVLGIAELAVPKPKATELLIKVHATALNRADISQRRGSYPPPPGHCEILGLEIAGEVAETGNDVTGFKPGDKVFGLVDGGGYAEYCVIDANMAMTVPEGWAYEQAAAIPEVFLTAHVCLFQLGELQAYESVLIHAGGSGVGTAAIQMAHAIGAKVYVTAGSAEKIRRCVELGADAGIHYKKEDFALALQPLTQNQGVDVILDCIGMEYFARNLSSLKTEGRLIQIAAMTGSKCEVFLGQIIMKRLQIKGNTMRSRPLVEKQHITREFIQQWLPLLADGTLKPVIDSIVPFEQVQEAHRYLESNHNFGKVILRVV